MGNMAKLGKFRLILRISKAKELDYNFHGPKGATITKGWLWVRANSDLYGKSFNPYYAWMLWRYRTDGSCNWRLFALGRFDERAPNMEHP